MNKINSNIADILIEIGVLSDEGLDELPRHEYYASEFLKVAILSEGASRLVDLLFPNSIPINKSFFYQLTELREYIGYSDIASEAIGLIWSEALTRLNESQQLELLHIFAEQSIHELLENGNSLHVVIRDHAFKPHFLSEWFTKLYKVVEHDLMQDSVLSAIHAECKYHFKDATQILFQLSDNLSPTRLSISYFILGCLRIEAKDEDKVESFNNIEKRFEQSREFSLREIFYWSWLASSKTLKVSDNVIEILISHSAESQKDLNCITSVICRLICSNRLTQKRLRLCINWLSTTVNSNLSGDSKYNIVWAATSLLSVKNVSIRKIRSWIQNIQPVKADNVHTWGKIGHYLYYELQRDESQFQNIFLDLCKNNAETIQTLFMKQKIERLLNELKKRDIAKLLSSLLLSADALTRKLGLYLLDENESGELSRLEFGYKDCVSVRILFYELQRTELRPTSIARILSSIAHIAENSTDEFREQFVDELKFQCHNFSGSFRLSMTTLAGNNSLVSGILDEMTCYLERLKGLHDNNFNAMEVAGYDRATIEQARYLNKHISKFAQTFSPLISMMNHISLLYGEKSSQFINGMLQEPIALINTSSSVEVPVLSISEPEEVAIRKIHANSKIKELSSLLSGENEQLHE